ncbi:MAG: amidohydrolase [Pseudomonadota bacterium]
MLPKSRFALDRRHFLLSSAALAATTAARPGYGQTNAPADLIVTNARITTMDPARPEASALAARDGVFVAVGDMADVAPFQGAFTAVIDAGGRRLIPGLNDSHTHGIRGAVNYNMEVRWDAVDSLEEGLHLLRLQADRTPEDQFIRVVGGFSEHQFKEKRLPTVAELDAVAPNHPVLIHYLYKYTLLNTKAVAYFGYDQPDHPTYPGGFVEKVGGDPTGRLVADPSGALMYQTLTRAPKLSISDQINSSLHYFDELNALGLTSMSDAGGGGMVFPDAEPYQVIRWLADRGLLTTRIGYHTFPQIKGQEYANYDAWTQAWSPQQGDDMLKLVGAGENLCWASYDYEIFDAPIPELDADAEEVQTRIMTLLGERGWPFRQHITYAESAERLLTVYEDVAQGAGLADGWFVDHVETWTPAQLERIAALGGGFALQNRLQFQAEDFARTHGMERLKTTPNFRAILDLGMPVGGGTDATRVTSYNPWYSIQWMTTGLSRGGMRMYDDANLLDREEALRLWTTGSAWFTGDAGRKGVITAGQMADFAVLDRDYFAVTDAEIARLRALLTAVGGVVVHATGPFATADLRHVPPVSPDWSPVAMPA